MNRTLPPTAYARELLRERPRTLAEIITAIGYTGQRQNLIAALQKCCTRDGDRYTLRTDDAVELVRAELLTCGPLTSDELADRIVTLDRFHAAAAAKHIAERDHRTGRWKLIALPPLDQAPPPPHREFPPPSPQLRRGSVRDETLLLLQSEGPQTFEELRERLDLTPDNVAGLARALAGPWFARKGKFYDAAPAAPQLTATPAPQAEAVTP